jgi:hypothetical protein
MDSKHLKNFGQSTEPLTIISKVIVPRIKEAKAHGIKNLMMVGSLDPLSMMPKTLSDVAADPKLREKFARELLDILQQNDFLLFFDRHATDHRISKTLFSFSKTFTSGSNQLKKR